MQSVLTAYHSVAGSRGRSAAVEAVPVPRAQMMGKQDWRFVSGGAQLMLRKAHQADADITSLAFSADNLTLLSRAADDTLKVCLHQISHLQAF